MKKKIRLMRGYALMRGCALPITIFILILLLDRVTKWWALSHLQRNDFVIFPGLALKLAWNRGVSWGLFNGSSTAGFWILTSLVALIILFFTFYTINQYKKGQSILLEMLVLSGAVSNFFDRIYYGAVIDFIDCYAYGWHWPTFNVADACIVLGIGGIIYKLAVCPESRS